MAQAIQIKKLIVENTGAHTGTKFLSIHAEGEKMTIVHSMDEWYDKFGESFARRRGTWCPPLKQEAFEKGKSNGKSNKKGKAAA